MVVCVCAAGVLFWVFLVLSGVLILWLFGVSGLLLLGLLVAVISVNSVVTSGSYMIYVCVLVCGF